MESLWIVLLCLYCLAVCSDSAVAEEFSTEGTELHSKECERVSKEANGGRP